MTLRKKEQHILFVLKSAGFQLAEPTARREADYKRSDAARACFCLSLLVAEKFKSSRAVRRVVVDSSWDILG